MYLFPTKFAKAEQIVNNKQTDQYARIFTWLSKCIDMFLMPSSTLSHLITYLS